MSQAAENTLEIYNRIIEETIRGCEGVESQLVLEKLKARWIEILNDKLNANNNKINESVKNEMLAPANERVKTELIDPVGTGISRLTHSQPAVKNMRIGFSDSRQMNDSTNIAHCTSESSVGASTIVSCHSSFNTPVKLEIDANSSSYADEPNTKDHKDDGQAKADGSVNENDDDWGEWEVEEPSSEAPCLEVEPVIEEESQNDGNSDYCDEHGEALPEDKDFETQMITNYGNTTTTEEVDNMDDINSDLDEVDTLDCDEPDAVDSIIGLCEEVTRPGSRNTRSTGQWKFKVRSGIATIGGQEILFDKLIADFEF